MTDNRTQRRKDPKDIIYGELRFQTHDHNEQTYQDITLVNFVKLGNEEN